MTLAEQLQLADQLSRLDRRMMQPNELPGRYGRVITDLERLLRATQTAAVVAGGWAVWRHGYVGRVTDDVDVVIPQTNQGDLLEDAKLFGFEVLQTPPGVWPKLVHLATDIEVALMPEHAIPGTQSNPGPLPIRHPGRYGGIIERLRYVPLANLIELKLGAGRAKDIADCIELIKVNRTATDELHEALSELHPKLAEKFETLVRQADEEGERS